MTDTDREAFEAWFKANQLDINPSYWTREYACWHTWQAATQRQQSRIAELLAEYERACQLVASMHAAAVGASIGPIRGIVEDVADLKAKSDALEAEVQALRKDAEWRPIETAPKDDTRVLVWIADKQAGRNIAFATRVWFFSDGTIGGGAEGYNGRWKLTHWKPLPPAPGAAMNKEGARD